MERSRRSTSSSIPCLHSRSRQGGNAWCACQTPGSLPSADRRLNDPKTPESVFTSGLIQRCQFVHGTFKNSSRLCQIARKVLCQIIREMTGKNPLSAHLCV